jgi:hypothetical protein
MECKFARQLTTIFIRALSGRECEGNLLIASV